MSVTVYGASDDLIEVEGDIREEFGFPWPDNASVYLGFSNGVVLRVTRPNVWRIAPVAEADLVQVTQCPEDDEDNYSDRATVAGRVTWVVCGSTLGGGDPLMGWRKNSGDLDDNNQGKAAAALSNRDNWGGLSESEKDALEAELNSSLTAEQKRTLDAFRDR